MRKFFFFLCVVTIIALPHESYTAVQKPLFQVVIDPGHGGTDLGTVYDNGILRVAEKDVTLALAQEAARYLRNRGIPVTLTRSTDEEVSLSNRTALANRLNANLFLSIHLNSSSSPKVTAKVIEGYMAHGIETYILNNATDASSRRLAVLENTVLSHLASTRTIPGRTSLTSSSPGPFNEQTLEKVPEKIPEKTDVALILKDLKLDANLPESKRLACLLQRRLTTMTSSPFQSQWMNLSRNRGVKQALFHVLLGAEMPSVLVEAGFLSHPYDRSLILSPQGRTRIGKAIAFAVEEFQQETGTPQAISTLSKCKVR